jgi:glycosyltransferase involved in cell wall biosynthesis
MFAPTSVAVVICTWNRAESLAITLQSLSKQRVPPDLNVEVWVIDNNSKDATAKVVAEAQKNWPVGQLIYRFEGRQGKQFALNHAIREIGLEVLAFTDDDILFPDDWIARVADVFADEKLQLAGGKTLLDWGDRQPPPWFHSSMQAVLGGVDVGDRRLAPPPPAYAPAGGNMAARKSLFQQVGAFSETHFRHMDYEFGLRCAAAGVATAYEPSMSVAAPVDFRCVSKRYFRRWTLKAGLSPFKNRSEEPDQLFKVPRWIYRQILQDCICLPFDCLFRSPSETFARELRIWRSYGAIASRWYSSLWPEKYPAWAERISQKTKDVY